MESFPLFFKTRVFAFTCTILFSFLWLVLLCVEVFTRWSVSDQISHSLMILFVFTNTITLIVLPMLILVEFRVWLDAARLLLLFVLQVGSATAGTYWSPKIQCPDQTPDDIGVCRLISVYTMMACWIIPAILVFYSTYFAAIVYLQSRIPVVVESKPPKRRSDDLEMGSTESLSLWMEKAKEIVGAQGSSTDGSISSRSLVSPTMAHSRQSSLPHSLASQRQSTLPNGPCRQPTMPFLPRADQEPFLSPVPSIPSRHCSLPASKHGNGAHVRPLLTLSVPRPLVTSIPSSHPQTPSSHSYSQSQSSNFGPSVVDTQPSKGSSRHLSMMPLSSSPREMPSVGSSPTTPRATRARLSKPLPAHLL